MDWTADRIRTIHIRERNFADIGYHYVIHADGRIVRGRSCDTVGAHCFGQNTESLGICLIGGRDTDLFTRTVKFKDCQFESLAHLLRVLLNIYGLQTTDIYSHSAFSDKTCPNFNVTEFINKYLELPFQ